MMFKRERRKEGKVLSPSGAEQPSPSDAEFYRLHDAFFAALAKLPEDWREVAEGKAELPATWDEARAQLGDAFAGGQNEAEAVRDFQAEWLRDQALITSDSVLDAVRLARGTITHVGGGAARAVLDDLQRQAHEHAEASVEPKAGVGDDVPRRGNLQ